MLSPLAARNGHRKDDGTALLDHLAALAGLDSASLAHAIGASETLSALVAANSLARFNASKLSEALLGPATEKALRGLNESIAQSVGQVIFPALESLAASIEMPPVPGMEATLAELTEQISLNLPTMELLGSFGYEWAASLAAATAASRADALQAFDATTAAQIAELAGSRG